MQLIQREDYLTKDDNAVIDKPVVIPSAVAKKTLYMEHTKVLPYKTTYCGNPLPVFVSLNS